MSDFDEGLAAGLAIGKKKWGKNVTETEVEWKYPDDWPALPKAGEGECILLIRPSESRKKIRLALNTYYDGNLTANYETTINWGDGNIQSFDKNSIEYYFYPEHEYADDLAGQYLLIRIQTMYDYIQNGDGTTHRISTGVRGLANPSQSAEYLHSVLAASVGTGLESSVAAAPFQAMYVRFEMTDINELSVDSIYNDWSAKPYSGYYRYTYSVFTSDLTKRIDFTGSPKIFGSAYSYPLYDIKTISGVDSITKIHEGSSNIFSNSRAIEKLSFPNVLELGKNMWNNNYGVREIYLPKCTKIGANCFCSNYCLQKLTVAKGCEIDPTALQNNYQYVEIIEV